MRPINVNPLGLTALMFSTVLTCYVLAEPVIKAVEQQQYFHIKCAETSDLSGITWTGADNFFVVSNHSLAIIPLKLEIDKTSGKIESGKLGAMIPVNTTDLSDFEGIAWHPEHKRFYISCEHGNGIVGCDAKGDARFAVEMPRVFSRARANKSLESLTFGAGHFWTANEDTLIGDGAPSSRSKGGLVRIQKFDESFEPAGQFAYRTNPTPVSIGDRRTGVTDLCALPNGQLLALERVVTAGLITKIYLVDFKGASAVDGLSRLEGAEIKPLGKKLLFERYTGGGNYEGITLGPELEDGWRSLILVADSGGGSKHDFIPLRIKIEGELAEEKEQ